MNKSELKSLIKEMLREELDQLDQVDDQQLPRIRQNSQSQRNSHAYSAWTLQSLASNIYLSDSFQKAFKADGNAFGNEVYNVVAAEVDAKAPSKTREVQSRKIDIVMGCLKRLAADRDVDNYLSDWDDTDDFLARVYSNTHDDYGNEY